MPAIEKHDSLAAQLAELLGREIISLERIRRGRNSRVFRLDIADGERYVAKMYFHRRADSRDRLGVEFGALTFLRENGVLEVPRPILASRQNALAVYEFVEGSPIKMGTVSRADIDQSVAFLGKLSELRDAEKSGDLAAASEACFSMQDVVVTVQRRLSRLMKVKDRFTPLSKFLQRDFVPGFDQVLHHCFRVAQELGLTFESEVSVRLRTLSPSDFGFHNAIRRPDGKLTFIDFEYFGWDDPAKMICDFLLHPAMNLEAHHRARFFSAAVDLFRDDPSLPNRVQLLHPLFGLKWCLILLNEFVAEDLARRKFAARKGHAEPNRLNIQLDKAKTMLSGVVQHLTGVPNSPVIAGQRT